MRFRVEWLHRDVFKDRILPYSTIVFYIMLHAIFCCKVTSLEGKRRGAAAKVLHSWGLERSAPSRRLPCGSPEKMRRFALEIQSSKVCKGFARDRQLPNETNEKGVLDFRRIIEFYKRQ